MKPELELGISNLKDASFKAFRLYKPAFYSQWHYHPELELVYFVQGKGIRFIGDDIALYHEGDLFLIGENVPHTFVTYKEETVPMVEAWCVQFSRQLFEPFAECRALLAFFQMAKRGISFPQLDQYLVEHIKKVLETKGIAALIALLETLALLQNTANRVQVMKHDYPLQAALSDVSTRIRTAIDFINVHYQRSISLQEIADACHFSPNAFCRWFKQNMGLTFVEYLNKVRLTQACQLLLSTDWPIGRIAAQTGFENISTFNRLFQQKLQTSPSKYRGNI